MDVGVNIKQLNLPNVVRPGTAFGSNQNDTHDTTTSIMLGT